MKKKKQQEQIYQQPKCWQPMMYHNDMKEKKNKIEKENVYLTITKNHICSLIKAKMSGKKFV